jgi:cobalt/nickel transport system permease protein
MMFAHLVVAGVVEFALTAGVVTYLQRANLPLMRINHRNVHDGTGDIADDVARVPAFRFRFALIGLAVMAVLTPVGLLAPGSAFGEDAPPKLGFLRGYDFTSGAHPLVGYVVSAALGIVVIGLVTVGGLAISRRGRRRAVRCEAAA